MATKWGIVSTGKISNDFVRALLYLPRTEHEIVGVAARSKETAVEFVKKHGIQKAYTSYEELAADKNIDVVYIGTVNTTHFEISKLMLESGKNVLCEKPLCLSYKDSEALISLAREKKLFLMEAVWSRCFPVYDELRTQLKNKIIGEVLYVRVNFGIPISHVPRLNSKELGGGTVFDLGVYVLQFAMLVFGDTPELLAAGNLNSDGVDENVDYILKYPNGKTATMSTHSKVKLENSATIYGTNGFIKIEEPFWCPTSIILPEGKKEFPLPFKSEGMYHLNSEGFVYEANEVRKCLKEGLIESPKITHSTTLAIAKLQEEVCKILGANAK